MVNALRDIGDEDATPSSYNIMKALLLMRSALLPIWLAICVCASCGQPDVPAEVRATSDARPAERVTSARPRIVFLGDSLTAGYGLAKEESVPSLIQMRLRSQGIRTTSLTPAFRAIRQRAGSAAWIGRSKAM